jgi:4-hydroxy-tetrahydrodipicolinate reductase
VKILLIGHGKMGKLIEQTARASGDEIVAAYDSGNLAELADTEARADVVIDFSRPKTLDAVCGYIRRTGTPLLSGTTGYTPEQKQRLLALGETAPVLWSANYSIGVAVFYRLLTQISDTLKPQFDIEMTETHHNQKADAPSGTAKLLLSAIDPTGEYTPVYGREGNCGKRNPKEIGVHALRGGSVAGTHTVHFFGPDEELEITHRAASRQIFVNGALQMARVIAAKPAGVYDLQSLLFGE